MNAIKVLLVLMAAAEMSGMISLINFEIRLKQMYLKKKE